MRIADFKERLASNELYKAWPLCLIGIENRTYVVCSLGLILALSFFWFCDDRLLRNRINFALCGRRQGRWSGFSLGGVRVVCVDKKFFVA